MTEPSPARGPTLPRVDRPVVSVLMVTYGAREWVERAVTALVEGTPPVYELIVVDNGSHDGTRELLRTFDGARVVEAPRNLGFGVGTNLAALHARGEVLCLLNSDAVVPPGWLPPLLAHLEADDRVGAVVPAFVYPDGSLQEAGAIVEADGRVVALGAYADPAAAEWRFPRVAPYGSAACVLVRRRVFEELGGFDPAYGTAYYEDVDLAFRMRTAGLRVIVEPAVRVVHAQGASSPPGDAVARRDANRERFRRRFAAQLWGRPTVFGAPQPHRVVAARDFDAVDRVLVLVPSLRALSSRGGAVERLVRGLVASLRDGRVTAAAPGQRLDDAGAAGVDERLAAGIEVATVDDWDAWLEARQFHYSVVIGDDEMRERLSAPLARTQPQATRAPLPDDATVADSAVLAQWMLDHDLVPRWKDLVSR
jgi:GT2 family glycosyltransferase